MAEKTLKTRIALLYKSFEEWQSIEATYTPLRGEVCFCEVPTGIASAPVVLYKVGDGTSLFKDLDWASAKAADVYAWAKKENLEFSDLSETFIASLEEKISGVIEEDTTVTEIQEAIGAANERITELDTAKVEKAIVGSNGTAYIFNEADGGGSKFVTSDGTASYVGTHDNIDGKSGVQIYADTDPSGDAGVIIDVVGDGAYYTKGAWKPASERDIEANEIAVKGDLIAENVSFVPVAGEHPMTATNVQDAIEETWNAMEAGGTGSIVTLEKAATADAGYVATYIIKQGGNVVSGGVDGKINIPKDYLVKSAEVKECEEKDVPVEGLEVGDKYIDFVINAKDDDGTESHIYLPVKELVSAYTAGEGIIIGSDNSISVDVESIASVDYVDDSISDTMNFIIQERDAEKAAREAGDNLKVDKVINGTNGKAEVFNESDGGGVKFTHNDGTESFVGVNDGGEDGLVAQIYADKLVDGKWNGAKLDVTNQGIYYTVGNKSFAERAVEDNLLATKGDIAELGDGKLDIMPGDEHTAGNAYNLPYFFYTEEGADKIVVHSKTISLDGNKTQGDYTLDVLPATEEKAGLMSAADKTNLDKAVLEDDVLILNCNF